MWREGFSSAMQSREFWTNYLFITDADPDDTTRWLIDFPLGTTDTLRLDIEPSASDVSLELLAAGCELPLGWDDQAHWHPHCLRWPEMLAIRQRLLERGVSQDDADATLLLLLRFAPITSESEAHVALPLLDAAWSRLNLLSQEETAQALSGADFRVAGVSWYRDASHGWVIRQVQPLPAGQPEIYSLRRPGGKFPTVEWRRLVAEIGLQDDL